MQLTRAAGILLHPTSLPSPHGIGDLGPHARAWVDFLADAGCQLWQILPLGPTGYGDSPYQSFSAFAGNRNLISPDDLLEDGLLTPADVAEIPAFPAERVDFNAVITWKLGLLNRAYEIFKAGGPLREEFDAFQQARQSWLHDYALFRALKEAHGGAPWTQWPAPLRQRKASALREARRAHAEAIERYAFWQFLFFRQWDKLHAYAEGKGVRIIGDLPIYVAHDSADTWRHPELFQLDKEGWPLVVAGVPPDYFSETGQLWGNPLYRWKAHAKEGYAWWQARIRATLEQVEILRVDHFRGFAAYWEVPGDKPTAEIGRWTPGPGAQFFSAIRNALGDLPVIAEDLGAIDRAVLDLRDQFNFPGMRILQFGFVRGDDDPFLPHNYPEHAVVYTGTHDNETARGWFEHAPANERQFCLDYLGTDGRDIAWDMLRALWASRAGFAIAPLQDFLSLGDEGRMNYPGRPLGNWDWRVKLDALTTELNQKIGALNREHGRYLSSTLV